VELLLATAASAVRQERAAGLSRWLLRQQQLQSLSVEGNSMSRPTLLLPTAVLQHLRHLNLQHCRVKFVKQVVRSDGRDTGSSNSHSSSHAAFWPAGSSALQMNPTSTLQHLLLQGCVLDWPPEAGLVPPGRMDGAATLQLQNLKQLHLQQLLPMAISTTADLSALQHLAPAAFQQMTGLTSLVLTQLNHYQPVLLGGLAGGLSCMQQLQELRVESLQLTAAAVMQLPSSLTLLELAGAKQLYLSSSSMPGLDRLPNLQQLLIEGVRGFEPRLLFNMPKLQVLRLRISSSRFLPDGSTGTQDLLGALLCLQELQALDLRNVLQHLLPDELLQAYAGLTASSMLQQLDLSACRFPPKCGQLLFAPDSSSSSSSSRGSNGAGGGRRNASRLPHLRQLVLYRCEDPPGSVLQLHSLSSLVCCCPALADLAFWLRPGSTSSNNGGDSGGSDSGGSSGGSAVGFRDAAARAGQRTFGLHLQALQGLTALTKLVVAGPGVTNSQVAAVAQLQQLQSLAMYRCSPLADASLLCLTHLRQLTSLAVDAHSCVTKWAGFSEYLYLQGREGGSVQRQDSQRQVGWLC
jgi:hypothetical protein